MRYVGGKARLARHIVPILDVPADAVYIEPFVGGANVMAAQAHVRTRIGADASRYLIALHRAIAAGWVPPAEAVDKEAWTAVRDNKDQFPDHVVGFVGFCASMHGDFFRCFIGLAKDARQTNRVTYAESGRNVLTKAHAGPLRAVEWLHCSYDALHIPDGAYVYCDPPYAGTQGYSTGAFDSSDFWRWAAALRERCTVRVSEFSAPAGWRCIWEQARPLMGSGAARRTKIERLFA